MLWAIRHEPKAGVPTMGVGRLHVLLILLASYCNADGITYVSSRTLAHELGLYERHVRNGLAELTRQG